MLIVPTCSHHRDLINTILQMIDYQEVLQGNMIVTKAIKAKKVRLVIDSPTKAEIRQQKDTEVGIKIVNKTVIETTIEMTEMTDIIEIKTAIVVADQTKMTNIREYNFLFV